MCSGYGDVAPQTTLERAYVIGGIFIGASLYAYMVGAVCGIVANMDPDESEFFGTMDTCAPSLHTGTTACMHVSRSSMGKSGCSDGDQHTQSAFILSSSTDVDSEWEKRCGHVG